MKVLNVIVAVIIISTSMVDCTTSTNSRTARMSDPSTPFWAARGERTLCDCDYDSDGKDSVVSGSGDNIQEAGDRKSAAPETWNPDAKLKYLPLTAPHFLSNFPKVLHEWKMEHAIPGEGNLLNSHWNNVSPSDLAVLNSITREWRKQISKRSNDGKAVDSSTTPFWAARG